MVVEGASRSDRRNKPVAAIDGKCICSQIQSSGIQKNFWLCLENCITKRPKK